MSALPNNHDPDERHIRKDGGDSYPGTRPQLPRPAPPPRQDQQQPAKQTPASDTPKK